MKRYHVKDGGWGYEAENGLWVDYDEAHAIEQERDALRVKLDNSRKATDYWKAEINKAQSNFDKLKSELAALKAPPKILKAEEVTQAGYYWWRGEYKEWEPVRVDIDEFGVDVWRIMTEIPAYDGEWGKPYGEFIGPLKATEVTNT